MKKLIVILVVSLVSCSKIDESKAIFRSDFTDVEREIMTISRDIISSCYFGSLITLDAMEQPRVRVMEPFAPDNEFIIWMATNPKSRKVKQLTANPKATMHYFDKTSMGYVSLMGNAFIVNDAKIKEEKWKDGWEKFYPNKTDGFMLIKFIPDTLELISISKGFTGDEITWKPHVVLLRE